MISTSVKAPAKLNLFLDVYAKRPDGFHNILTLFERIDLFDKIVLKRNQTGKIIISCDSPEVPPGKKNIIYRAADILRKKFLIKEGLNISIEKNIPVAAGLGGGSSDAAAVLLALNKLWQLKLGKTDLLKIAGKLGADVPFFITGERFSLSRQPQQVFKSIDTDIRLWHMLVVPNVRLSTKMIFAQFDRLKQPNFNTLAKANLRAKLTLTKNGKNDNMLSPLEKIVEEQSSLRGLTCLLAKLGRRQGLRLATAVHYNSLEAAATVVTPEVSRIKQTLLSLGAKSVGMSGSGPSVFAIVGSRKEGERLKERLSRFKGWRTYIVRTF